MRLGVIKQHTQTYTNHCQLLKITPSATSCSIITEDFIEHSRQIVFPVVA